MKIRVCDICGRKLTTFYSRYEFKRKTWFCGEYATKKLDICGCCIQELKEEARKKNEKDIL